jgi:hypothetical protein
MRALALLIQGVAHGLAVRLSFMAVSWLDESTLTGWGG